MLYQTMCQGVHRVKGKTKWGKPKLTLLSMLWVMRLRRSFKPTFKQHDTIISLIQFNATFLKRSVIHK